MKVHHYHEQTTTSGFGAGFGGCLGVMAALFLVTIGGCGGCLVLNLAGTAYLESIEVERIPNPPEPHPNPPEPPPPKPEPTAEDVLYARFKHKSVTAINAEVGTLGRKLRDEDRKAVYRWNVDGDLLDINFSKFPDGSLGGAYQVTIAERTR